MKVLFFCLFVSGYELYERRLKEGKKMTVLESALIFGWIGFVLGALCVLNAIDREKKEGARK